MSGIFAQLLEEDQRQKAALHPTEVLLSPSKAIFPSPNQALSKPSNADLKPLERPSDEATERQTDKPTERRHNETPLKRPTQRAAFDIYQDQVQAIRRLRAERELEGDCKVSLSDIAREAIDLYLQKNGKYQR